MEGHRWITIDCGPQTLTVLFPDTDTVADLITFVDDQTDGSVALYQLNVTLDRAATVGSLADQPIRAQPVALLAELAALQVG